MSDRIDYSDRVTHLFEHSTASTVSISDSSDSEEISLGKANHMPSSDNITSSLYIVGSGASTHMCPIRNAFVSYTATPRSYVSVANNIKAPCLGMGSVVFYLHDKFIKVENALHVPDLNNILFSISEHRRYQGCSFLTDFDRSFLQFPSFRLKVGDSQECCLPVHFLNDFPSPLPKLDLYTTTVSACGFTVTTRSITNNPASNNAPSAIVETVVNEVRKPTTTTPDGFPSPPVMYKQFSSHPLKTRFTTHQLHLYLGSRSLKKWQMLQEMAQDTVQVSNIGKIPLDIGDVANLKASRKNTTPVPRRKAFLDVVHCDLAYRDCASIGGRWSMRCC